MPQSTLTLTDISISIRFLPTNSSRAVKNVKDDVVQKIIKTRALCTEWDYLEWDREWDVSAMKLSAMD